MALVWPWLSVPGSTMLPKYFLPLAVKAVFKLLDFGPVDVPVATAPAAAAAEVAAAALEVIFEAALDGAVVEETAGFPAVEAYGPRPNHIMSCVLNDISAREPTVRTWLGLTR